MITGDDIRRTRERVQESQAAFAARFGVDQSTIHRWETEGLPDRGVTRLAVERVIAELVPPQTDKAPACAS